MFKGGGSNPYEEIVAKATDENLTAENWELIITLCDKVVDEGETGARHVVSALLKRLTHRNPNVQLYSLSLAESLSKNCGIEVHREIASRSFTQALERIVTDRTTHDKVKRRVLTLIAMWTIDFQDNSSLGIMEECYENLKAKNYDFEPPQEAPPPQVDDELRRKEEEELQRVLEMSMHDKGGRGQWADYSAATSTGAGGSGSTSNLNQYSLPSDTTSKSSYKDLKPDLTARGDSSIELKIVDSPINADSAASQSLTSVTRVRALHSFQPTEPGELQFEKGDIIKVVDRNYKEWWRGQLRGRTGIFPVNYVEPLPEPTAAEIAREAEQEAALFAQSANIDKLLTMLRELDPSKDSLADNEEIQELYRLSMSLRPKIVKLIDKYNQKKSELVLMNESFIKAKTIFERMMEDSLARHTSEYDARPVADFGNAAAPYSWNNPTYDPSPVYNQFGPRQQSYSQIYPSAGDSTVYPASPSQFQAPGQTTYGPTFPQATVLHQQRGTDQTQHYTSPQQPVPSQTHPGQSTDHIVLQTHPQQTTMQGQSPAMIMEGTPPYDYDPNGQYADAGAQAWARYYARGGIDPAGAVYFKFVPGVTSSQSRSPTSPSENRGQGINVKGLPLQQTQPESDFVQRTPQLQLTEGIPMQGASESPGVPYQESASQLNAHLSSQSQGQPQQHPPNFYPDGHAKSARQDTDPPHAAIQQLQQHFESMSTQDALHHPGPVTA